jgi:Na+-driven multidrug efflux pump
MKKFVFKLDKEVDRGIIKLAWPSITEQILEMMVGMVSTMFMGRIGTSAVAAVGIVNMLMGLLQTVFSGLAIGTTAIIARLTGEGNKAEAKRALIQSVYMVLTVGILLAITGKIFSKFILNIFLGGAEIKLFSYGLSYFKIILISLPFFVLDIIVSGAMRGAGDTKTPMIIGFVIGILMIIFARHLACLYSKDPLVIKESVSLIRTFGLLEPLMAILNLCSSTLRTAGDIKYVMVTSFVGLWSLRVFLSYSLNRWFGIGMTAIMIGIFFDFSSRSIMYLFRMNKGKWKYIRI